MPIEVENRLKQEAETKFPIPEGSSEGEIKRIQKRRNKYVYGTLDEIEHPETHWYWRRSKHHAM